MFRGSSIVTLDDKFRLAVPKKFRDRLFEHNSSLIITAHPDKCLVLYSLPSWAPIEKKLMSLSSFDPKISTLQRLLIGYADEVDPDKAGRILLSASLREFAGIQQETIMLGQGSHFEIWDKNIWSKKINSTVKNLNLENFHELEGFSL